MAQESERHREIIDGICREFPQAKQSGFRAAVRGILGEPFPERLGWWLDDEGWTLALIRTDRYGRSVATAPHMAEVGLAPVLS